MKYIDKQIILGSLIAVLVSGLVIYSNCGGKTDGTPGGPVTPQTPFVSVWQTTTANETIILPLRQGFEYNMVVDWGDSSPTQKITSWNDNDKVHEYATAGEYTITLRGLAEAWYFNDNADSEKILKVTDLGEMGWKNLENAFSGCDNLTTFEGGDTSNVTTMAHMFQQSYNAIPEVGDWDTSKVTNMSYLFDSIAAMTLDVGDWDTSKVTNMSYMFSGLSANVDLTHWDTSKVTNMDAMFVATVSNPDVSHLDTSKVTNMHQMFYLSSVDPDTETWNFASVTTMQQMLTGSQISNVHYTTMLKRIHETRTVNGVTLNATAQYYTSATAARASLVGTSGWIISDNGSGGADPP